MSRSHPAVHPATGCLATPLYKAARMPACWHATRGSPACMPALSAGLTLLFTPLPGQAQDYAACLQCASSAAQPPLALTLLLVPLQPPLHRRSLLMQDYAAVALLAVICSLLETLVGKDGMLNDFIPDFALLHALQWVSWPLLSCDGSLAVSRLPPAPEVAACKMWLPGRSRAGQTVARTVAAVHCMIEVDAHRSLQFQCSCLLCRSSFSCTASCCPPGCLSCCDGAAKSEQHGKCPLAQR